MRLSWSVTRSLLILLKQLESKSQNLIKVGVTVLDFEAAQIDIIHTILQVNRIQRNDPGVDFITHPIFLFLEGSIELRAALEQMATRLEELQRERKAQVG